MKYIKLVLYLMMIILSTLLGMAIFRYIGWRKIYISGIGSIKVPCQWTYIQKENMIYFTDKADKIFFLKASMQNLKLIVTINERIVEVKALCIDSSFQSNGALIGQYELELNGSIRMEYFIKLEYNENSITLVTWENHVDVNTIKKIANSYEPDWVSYKSDPTLECAAVETMSEKLR